MTTKIRYEIARLSGPAQALAQLISDISLRVFKQEWNCDIEWDLRRAMDNGSFTIQNVKPELDAMEGALTPTETNSLLQLRQKLNDGWVHLDGLNAKRYDRQPSGLLRSVSAQEWELIGTAEYRLKRYEVR